MQAKRMRILVAEDDPSVSQIARLALEKLGGHLVDIVSDGLQAVEKALSNPYDLILLDWMMPGCEGPVACAQIRNSGLTSTPIIILSAKSQSSEIAQCMRAGAMGYIQKPFDPRTLCRSIDEILDGTHRTAA